MLSFLAPQKWIAYFVKEVRNLVLTILWSRQPTSEHKAKLSLNRPRRVSCIERLKTDDYHQQLFQHRRIHHHRLFQRDISREGESLSEFFRRLKMMKCPSWTTLTRTGSLNVSVVISFFFINCTLFLTRCTSNLNIPMLSRWFPAAVNLYNSNDNTEHLICACSVAN